MAAPGRPQSVCQLGRMTGSEQLLPLGADDWPHVQLRRQVIRCLEDGEITGGPETNEFGHWEYQMMRVSAGQEIYLTAVLYQDEGDGEWIVFVKEVTNGEY